MSSLSVRASHIIIVSAILAASITLLSAHFYYEIYTGYNDYGFPLPWKRVYGGVTTRYDFVNLSIDFIIWMVIITTILWLALKYGLHAKIQYP